MHKMLFFDFPQYYADNTVECYDKRGYMLKKLFLCENTCDVPDYRIYLLKDYSCQHDTAAVISHFRKKGVFSI